MYLAAVQTSSERVMVRLVSKSCLEGCYSLRVVGESLVVWRGRTVECDCSLG